MRIKILVSILFVVLLQACSSGPKYTPMTLETKNSIKDLDVYNLVLQDEIKPAIEISNVSGALGGGLIGAVIDSSINKSRGNDAQSLIKSLYDSTNDYDFRKQLAHSFNSKIDKEFTVNIKHDSAEAVLLSNKVLSNKVKSLDDDTGLLYMSTFYLFLNNSKNLVTETILFLYTNKNIKKGKLSDPSYFNSVYFESDTIGEGGIDSLNKWQENNGQLFLSVLNESINQATDMMIYDFQVELNEQCLKEVSSNYSTILSPVTAFKGKILKTDNSRSLFRANTGKLMSTSRDYKLSKSKLPEECKVGEQE